MTTLPLSLARAGVRLALGWLLAFSIMPPVHAETNETNRLAGVARDFDRVESVRAIKRLQYSYAQYSEFGSWDEMASLFARAGVIDRGGPTPKGPTAIAKWLRTRLGNGRDGLPPGGLHTQMSLAPVITISPDGEHARGRWHELSLIGRLGGEARWEGGMQENEYVREDGVWKIARLHHVPLYAGPYETGWRSIGAEVAQVPYHFTAKQAGDPIGGAVGTAPQIDSHVIAARLARMHDEDQILNLQNAYGYYIDRKMWTDVTDLFTADGVLELAGIGVWRGEQGIRRLLQIAGPPGLEYGEVNDHLQIDPIVTVSRDGTEAWARGLDFGMLGLNHVSATWTEAIFENHYVKEKGIWRIKEMRLFPKLRSDYYQGWGKNQMPEPPPPRGFEPDTSSALMGGSPEVATIPAFRNPNPVTGRPVRYPKGVTVIPTGAQHATQVDADDADAAVPDVAELERQLAVELARDSVENVSSAFAAFLDDFQWDKAGDLFAVNGRREKYQIGFYVGRERVRTADTMMYGTNTGPRKFVQYHLRVQPVITVSPDGKSARLRTRLFSWGAMPDKAGEFSSGMYPNDVLVLEEGSWKFQHQAINETFFKSDGYANGWAKVRETDPKEFALDRSPTRMDKLRGSFPPDVLATDMGVRTYGYALGPHYREFPAIKPAWFHYVNPVSGRVPDNYCPDEATCYQRAPLFEPAR